MKAVFLDRDGIVNPLVYYNEHGIIDSPFTPEQFTLLPGVTEAISSLQADGYIVIIASNQPGIAKGHLTKKTFNSIRSKMNLELTRKSVCLDGEYYCFHHPEAVIDELRVRCQCRKPESGLLIQAAEELAIDLSQSWMIGDGLTDILAGKRAGCRTILVARMKCELCEIMHKENAQPDAVLPNLADAAGYIIKQNVLTNPV